MYTKEKSSHTSKIKKEKRGNKIVAEREGLGWEIPIDLLWSLDRGHVPLTLHSVVGEAEWAVDQQLHLTHTRKKNMENPHSRMKETSSKFENFAC